MSHPIHRCLATTRRTSSRATIGIVSDRAELSCALTQAAANLRVSIRPIDGRHPPSADDGCALAEFVADASACDVVTFDQNGTSPAHVDVLEDSGLLLRPNRQTFLFTRSSATARSTLRRCGFEVSTTPQTRAHDFTVIVIRRPSGHLVAYPPTPSVIPALAPGRSTGPSTDIGDWSVATAIAVANGMNAIGSLVVDFVIDGTRPLIHDVRLGPDPRARNGGAVAMMENHLRALLDWPLRARNARSTSAPSFGCCLPDPDLGQ